MSVIIIKHTILSDTDFDSLTSVTKEKMFRNRLAVSFNGIASVLIEIKINEIINTIELHKCTGLCYTRNRHDYGSVIILELLFENPDDMDTIEQSIIVWKLKNG
jgi:hypothetical protein